MQIDFRPIKVWPDGWRETDFGGVGTPFSATWVSTLDLLERELYRLSARTVIVQLAIRPEDVRADGALRSNAKVNYRGVILSFDGLVAGKRRPLVYACNAFLSSRGIVGPDSWQHNLRAVALGLEALRKIERYGIANRGEQYAGWAELGTGIPVGPATMTLTEAACFVADESYEPGAPIFQRCDGGDLLLDAFTITGSSGRRRVSPSGEATPSRRRRDRRSVQETHRGESRP